MGRDDSQRRGELIDGMRVPSLTIRTQDAKFSQVSLVREGSATGVGRQSCLGVSAGGAEQGVKSQTT